MNYISQLISAISLTSVFCLLLITQVSSEGSGKFLDTLSVDYVGPQKFKLKSKFRYIDPNDTLWVVPKDTEVNGASIPPYLWSFIGAPWTGKYVEASVIHDYFFDQKKYDSEKVHRVFFDAMLTSGVDRIKAKIMYFAVLWFNDEWRGSRTHNCLGQEIGPGTPAPGDIKCIRTQGPITVDWSRRKIEFDERALKKVVSETDWEKITPSEIKQRARSERKHPWSSVE